MSTFTVTQTTDNGLGNTAGTLSYAILQANQLAGDDVIVLNNNVRLTGATVIPSFIDSNITLEGNGFSLSGDVNNNGINDSGDTRPLFIKSGIVSITNLTITNGRAQGEDGSGGGAGMGGGLFIYDGAVSLNNVVFSNNAALGGNGGLYGRGGGMGIPSIPANNGADGSNGDGFIDFNGYIYGVDGGNGTDGKLGGNGGNGGHGDSVGTSSWEIWNRKGGDGGNGGNGGWGGHGGQGGEGGDGDMGGNGGKGGNGGFGGGGAAGNWPGAGWGSSWNGHMGYGGDGGFGAGGGAGYRYGGWMKGYGGLGGYGGGSGYDCDRQTGFGAGQASWYGGGAGAGMGGGLFIRSGSVSLNHATFTNNSAAGGIGYQSNQNANGQGLGGGLFIMQSLTNSNGNNQGMPTVLPTVTANGLVIFSGNSAADDSGTATDNDDIWGTITTLSNAIMGTEGDDVLVGTSADDLMMGLGGNDRLDGKGGADEMRGGLGNDTFTVNDPGDLVVESADEGADTVKTYITYVLPDNVENLTLLGTANLDGTGNSLNNKLTGNNGDNLLIGGEGNDTLDGKAGNDLLRGGLGDDTYLYRHPGSVIVENANEGMDTVKAYFSYGLGANLENLTLMGADDLDGIGNHLDNKLTGNSGDNLLNGGAGADILTGKGGANTFVFNFGQSLVSGPDWIKDFTLGEDKIDLLTQGGWNLNAPVNLTRAADNKAATLTEVMTQVFTDADGAVEGNQALGINSAALVKVTTPGIRGTYLVVNNSNALFQADKDLLINITGLKGGLPDFGAVPIDSFFI